MDALFPVAAEAMGCMAPAHVESGDPFAEVDSIFLGPHQAMAGYHYVVPAQCPDNYALLSAAQSMVAIKSEEQAWPSPPLGPGDLGDGQYGQDFDSSIAPFSPEYPMIAPLSPDAWSTVGAALLQPSTKFAEQSASDGCEDSMCICTPASLSPKGAVSFPSGASRFDGPSTTALGQAAGPYEGTPLAPEELLAGTPPFQVDLKMESPESRAGKVPMPNTPRALGMGAPTPEGRLDEPYAQLIFRAFMTRPDHAMTLQDIYQWFRDNTNKAVTEKGGWQNSIRHNLSMNAAFTKRHRKDNGRSFRTILDDAKRPNEWVLEDWAACFGVQSTTRYRKGNSRRRNGPRSTSQRLKQLTQHSAKRAVSGRKGGCAARDSRLRDRAQHRRRSMLQAQRAALERQCASPDRPTAAEMYTAEGFGALPMHPATLDCGARPMHCGHAGARASASPVLAIRPSLANMSEAQAMTEFVSDYGDQMCATYGAQAQAVLPYGIRDAQGCYYDG